MHTNRIHLKYFGAVVVLGMSMVYQQKEQSADADGTSGEKMSAQQKAMVDRIEQSEKLIKRLRTKIRKLDSSKDELKSIKFIGVEFDPDTYQRGESEINSYLDKGFTVIRDYQTASGLVMTLGKFTKRGKKE